MGFSGACFAKNENARRRFGGLVQFGHATAHDLAVAHKISFAAGLQAQSVALVQGRALGVRQPPLEGLQLGDVADAGHYPPDIALTVKNGGAGIEAAGSVGIIVKPCDDFLLLQGIQRDRSGEFAFQYGHGNGFSHHLRRFDIGDTLHGPVDVQGNAVTVDNPHAIVH